MSRAWVSTTALEKSRVCYRIAHCKFKASHVTWAADSCVKVRNDLRGELGEEDQ